MALMNTDGSISFIRGDTIRFPMVYTEDDGTTAVDLTGYEIAAQIRSKPNGYIVLDFEILQEDPTDGTDYDLTEGAFLVYAARTATELIRLEEAFWDLQLTSPGGLVQTLIGPAAVEIIKDITPSA